MLGRFYGEVDDDQVAQSRYYERSKAIKTAESSYKAAIKAGDDKAIERMEESTPELMMARTFARTQQNISKLNKLAVQVVNDPAEMREIDTARTELMKSANEAIAEMEREDGKVTLADRLRKTVAPKLAEAQ